jgi:CRISPR/Cas system endoribonuclease Cas6 (RAMP superfamily)
MHPPLTRLTSHLLSNFDWMHAVLLLAQGEDHMLVAAVVNVKAEESGTLAGYSGDDVHGFWFKHWAELCPSFADSLHEPGPKPFTVSPLMGLPCPQRGLTRIERGQRSWFRVTALTDSLSARLEAEWLPGLPQCIRLGTCRWRLLGFVTSAAAHPWAGTVDLDELAEQKLSAASPPVSWQLGFETPTSFHGDVGHLAFPLPNVLVRSWLETWRPFCSPALAQRLPEDLPELARYGLVVSSYDLGTVPVRLGQLKQGLFIGCVGRVALRALKPKYTGKRSTGLEADELRAVDLLAALSLWSGSGHHTALGLGMTRPRTLTTASSHEAPDR